jgi:uridine kinase
MERRFVVISGLPGSGKTSLARRLSSAMGLPLIDKDDLLEKLFESKGTGDREWRRTLSRESDRALHTAAAASDGGAVLVSFWHQRGMAADSGTPTRWLSPLSPLIVNVRCACPAETAATRFLARKRHAGHLDSETLPDVLVGLRALEDLDPIDVGPHVDVDTSREPDLALVIADINAAFARCARRAGHERQALLQDLASKIVSVPRPHPVRVAIDGVDAAGKTTLAEELAPVVKTLGRPVIRASIDGFHHPREIRRRRGELSPEGYFHDSFNYLALTAALLEPLGPDGSRTFRRAVFDFQTDSDVDAPVEHAEPNAVLLFDGVFLLRPELRVHFDFSVFLKADFSVTMARAERRDVDMFGGVDVGRRRYQERYVPGQQLYLASAQPEKRASVVVDNNDPARARICHVNYFES